MKRSPVHYSLVFLDIMYIFLSERVLDDLSVIKEPNRHIEL